MRRLGDDDDVLMNQKAQRYLSHRLAVFRADRGQDGIPEEILSSLRERAP